MKNIVNGIDQSGANPPSGSIESSEIANATIVNEDISSSAAIGLSKLAATTASRALVSDVSGFITASAVTATEVGYLDNATSEIQGQLNTKLATTVFDTHEDYQFNMFSAGRLYGGVITDSGSGQVDISAGAGLVKATAAGLEDIPSTLNGGQGSDYSLVTWTARENFALAGVGYNLVYWDASAGDFAVQLKEDFYTNFDFTRDFTIGRVYYDGSVVTVRLCGMNVWNFPRRVQMFGEERFPVERATGMMISASGTRNIAITAGVIWAELVNRFSIDAFDSSASGTFTYWYRDGGTGWTSVATQTQIDNTYYDDGTGTLNDLTANRYGVHWVYEDHKSGVHVVYGQDDYTLANANLASPPTTLPGLVGAYATLVGKIVIQKSAAAFTSIQSPFTTQFTAGSVTNHNDLSSLQGGTTGEYYHLTSAQATVVGNTSGANTGDEPSASDSVAGIVELALGSEVTTGTSTSLAVTPDALAGSNYGKRVIGVQVVDAVTDVVEKAAAAIFMIPETMNGWNLVGAHATCYTAGVVSDAEKFEIAITNRTDSQLMLETNITIDSTELNSHTAATPPAVNAAYDDVATGDLISIDINDVFEGTAPQGLYVELTFQLP